MTGNIFPQDQETTKRLTKPQSGSCMHCHASIMPVYRKLGDSDAPRTEMRSVACGQCHVEYYCSSAMPLTYPWSKGLQMEDLEQHWNETKLPDGGRFFDYKHTESGAEILKAQHPHILLRDLNQLKSREGQSGRGSLHRRRTDRVRLPHRRSAGVQALRIFRFEVA